MNIRALGWCSFVFFLSGSVLIADEFPSTVPVVNVEFARAGETALTLDAFIPEGVGPFPTCILVHGGGFVRGDKQSYISPLFEPLSKAGFTWFTINYRLAPAHRWPACVEDVEAAIRWVKAHATEYKVDVNRIALIGESAGGHLVSYVGARATDSTRVAAVVPFYAPHDLEQQVRFRGMLGESMTSLLGLTELNDDAWQRLREVSPSQYVHSGMVPFLLIHGEQDSTVPYDQSLRFQKLMQAAGNRCDLITVPGGGHGMGGWDKLKSPYRDQMLTWLEATLSQQEAANEGLNQRDDDIPDIADRLKNLGAQVTESNGVVTKVAFRDCSALGTDEFRLIGKLSGLQSLTLYGRCKGLTDETLPLLEGLSQLEDLGTDGIQVSDAGLATFAKLKNLRSLAFFHPSLGMPGFDGSGFAALRELPKLERLTIAGTSFNDEGLAAVAKIQQLREFRTWHTYQSQAGNRHLAELPNLHTLTLGQRLRRYDGNSNAVSLDDESILQLVKLSNLRSLTLDEARLSLPALKQLKQMDSLEKLELRRIDISTDDVAALRLALPGVTIEWKQLSAEERPRLEAILKE